MNRKVLTADGPRHPRQRQPDAERTVIPLRRHAWLIEGDDLHALELLAVTYDFRSRASSYLAVRCDNASAEVREYPARDVTFSEGAALRMRALRQRTWAA